MIEDSNCLFKVHLLCLGQASMYLSFPGQRLLEHSDLSPDSLFLRNTYLALILTGGQSIAHRQSPHRN